MWLSNNASLSFIFPVSEEIESKYLFDFGNFGGKPFKKKKKKHRKNHS